MAHLKNVDEMILFRFLLNVFLEPLAEACSHISKLLAVTLF